MVNYLFVLVNQSFAIRISTKQIQDIHKETNFGQRTHFWIESKVHAKIK